jgi:hypothetical protein
MATRSYTEWPRSQTRLVSPYVARNATGWSPVWYLMFYFQRKKVFWNFGGNIWLLPSAAMIPRGISFIERALLLYFIFCTSWEDIVKLKCYWISRNECEGFFRGNLREIWGLLTSSLSFFFLSFFLRLISVFSTYCRCRGFWLHLIILGRTPLEEGSARGAITCGYTYRQMSMLH